MADGAGNSTITVAEGLIDLAVRVGAVECNTNERVTHREMTQSHNDLRRDLIDKIEKSGSHTLRHVDHLIENLSLTLASSRDAEIKMAVSAAMSERDEQERKAREAFDRKIDDAYRGARGYLMAQGGGVVAIVFIGAFIIAKLLGLDL